jgi:cytochrome P450
MSDRTAADDVDRLLDGLSVADLDQDPYPVYARLRAERPVAYVPCVDTWFVTRYRDVQFVAEHPELFPATVGDSPQERTFGAPTIICVDGDVHHDLRRAFDPNFRPRRVLEYVDDLVRPLAEAALASLSDRSDAELMADYFEPVSVRSLAAVLGLTDVGTDTMRQWLHGLNLGATNFERDPVKQAASDEVCADIDAELVPRLERLSRHPDDSTLSHMLHAGTTGTPRSVEYVLPTLKTAILGGMQEPGHGAGSVLAGLFSQPDQWDEVAARPSSTMAAAVEEGIRWVAPIGTQFRTTVADVELGGATIPAGAGVSALLSSANRDASVFSDADRFDLHRASLQEANKVQAAFGFGKHFCSGHAFARHQMRIALDVLVSAYPTMRADPDRPTRFRGWEFRAPAELAVLL